MKSRHSFISAPGDRTRLCPVEGMERAAAIVWPIIARSDVTGAVITLQQEGQTKPQ